MNTSKLLTSVEFLNQILAEKRAINPRYSLRAFARDIRVEQSLLCKILNGKKKLKAEQACRIAMHLKLSQSLAMEFIYSTIED